MPTRPRPSNSAVPGLGTTVKSANVTALTSGALTDLKAESHPDFHPIPLFSRTAPSQCHLLWTNKTPNGARRRSPDLAVTADRRSPDVAKRSAIQATFGRN
jgi:hypothetical protein